MFKKTIIIAEAGVNHNGSIKKALQLIDKAAQAGADIVKCQITNPENKLLSWKIDTSVLDKTFNLNPSSGRIDGGKNIKIKVSFNPLTPGE